MDAVGGTITFSYYRKVMFSDPISYLTSLIVSMGALGVFLGVIIEEVIAPIPSAVVIMGAAFLMIPAELGWLEALWMIFWKIAIPASAGMVVGSSLIYGIGYWGGKPAITKWGKWFGIRWSDIEKAESRLSTKHADVLGLFFFRTIPIIPGVVLSAFYGVIRVPWKIYAFVTFVGSIIRAFVLGVIAWKAQGAYTVIAEKFNKLEDLVIVAVVAIALAGIGWFIWRKKKNQPQIGI